MNTNFKSLASIVGSIAPTLATMLGGPLAGAAVSSIGAAFGLGDKATAADITKVAQEGGMTPEIIAAVRVADQHHAEVMGQQGFDLAKLNADTATAFDTNVVADVSNAREAARGNKDVYDIGKIILLSFALYMVLVTLGCGWLLATGGNVNAGILAAVAGLVGAITGYFAANAQTVVNFLYGGSLGGRKNADSLASATVQLGASLGKAANAP